MTFIAICSEPYLNFYRELYKSLKLHSPHSNQILYFIGNNIPLEFDEVIDITEWDKNTSYLDQRVSICSLRARVVLDAFKRKNNDVIFCGAKVKFYKDPIELKNELLFNNAVVIPHILEPLPEDGKFPSNASVSFTGHISTDLIGFKKVPEIVAFLEWQDEIMKKNCNITHQTYLDQSWLNFLPFFVDKVSIFKDSRYNLAYWNFNRIDIKDVVAFQFSGLDINNPRGISKYQNRYIAEGDFLKFLEDYANKIK